METSRCQRQKEEREQREQQEQQEQEEHEQEDQPQEEQDEEEERDEHEINTNQKALIVIARALNDLEFPATLNKLHGWEIAALDDTRNQIICHERHASRKTGCSHNNTWHSNFASYLKHRTDCRNFCEPSQFDDKGNHDGVQVHREGQSKRRKL